ncbi:MAG TPA: hypothetical protein VKR55_02835 [Bradyrhizobium sp.]|uniref:hypothetical protein n=1 Tax=Bradyrhizobium sp. TaxID=376 RepID=UPI002BBB9F37|nr:hypothetical protein [Bradyrhizobium sp.]HLZ01069.1 hypothetical protein [Bradyrhizobium sp.]
MQLAKLLLFRLGGASTRLIARKRRCVVDDDQFVSTSFLIAATGSEAAFSTWRSRRLIAEDKADQVRTSTPHVTEIGCDMLTTGRRSSDKSLTSLNSVLSAAMRQYRRALERDRDFKKS